jgi:hypothetical protein
MRVQLLFGIVAFGATLHLSPRAIAQAPPDNWLAPLPKSTVTRDPGAIALIEGSLRAMNPLGQPPIVDLTLTGDVTRWFGKDAGGDFSESAIGMGTESISVRVDGQIAYKSFRTAGKETHQASNDLPAAIVNRRPIEQLPHLPQPLLQDLVRNDRDDIELIADDPEDSTVSRIRVILRPADWQPYMRDLKSASFDLYISKDTHLPKKFLGLNHFDATPHHVMPSELLFTDYRTEQGYLVPHSFEERYVGKSTHCFSARSIVLNQGLSPSSLN